MSEFAACLNEIREHHKKNIRDGKIDKYTPSAKFAHFFANDNGIARERGESEVIKGLELQGQSLGQKEASENQAAITSETEKLQQAGATPDAQKKFREELEKRRKAAQDQAIKNVDKIYDTALELGEQNPELQPQILSVTDLLSGFFTDLYGKISEFVLGIVKAVVEWLKHAWESIKTTFSNIANWISSWF